MIYPNIDCYYLCVWMLTISSQRLTGSQITVTQNIQAAALAQTGVTENEWNNFNEYAAWRNPYYLVYRDYAANSSPNLITSILAYYKLDGSNVESVSNISMSEANITYSTGNGKINQGAGFNGASSYIKSNSSITLSAYSALTVNLWVKYTTASTQVIFETSPNFNSNRGVIIITISGKISVGVSNGSGGYNIRASSTSINTGSWFMITAVINLADPNNYNQVLLFVNGVFEGVLSFTTLQTGLFTNQPINIGARAGASDWFSGAIDEIGMWSRSLSQSEILSLYNSGSGIQYPF